ncbi:hypothetical protein RR48_03517 [Papilio machaon]|uniref:Secreted protein n=1 Tax=Papilio machaon TaxID=76193 RepID=A0A0N1IPQ9_PAPMA|nr:hypothetical protein RR48_03517 [Papilio machaon]
MSTKMYFIILLMFGFFVISRQGKRIRGLKHSKQSRNTEEVPNRGIAIITLHDVAAARISLTHMNKLRLLTSMRSWYNNSRKINR